MSASSHTVPVVGPALRDHIVSRERTTVDESATCVCGEQDCERVFPKRIPRLQRCRGCGTQFLDPQPNDVELADIYNADYYQTFGYSESDGGAYRAMMQQRAERLLQTAEQFSSLGRLLDVGSGLGDLLFTARKRGWGAHGVEPNSYAVESSAAAVFHLTACCEIEEFAPHSDGCFDLITCLDVIEHLRRPDEVLTQLHGILSSGGGLVITTVDVGGLAARLLGRRWPHYHPDHLWYFTRTGLRNVVEKAGFEILHCGRARKYFTLHYLFSILARHQHSALLRTLARAALKCTPRWLAVRRFQLREGLIVIARRKRQSKGKADHDHRSKP